MLKGKRIVIALDAMGGDFSPGSVIEGANLALEKFKKNDPASSLEYLIYGNLDLISRHTQKFPLLKLPTELRNRQFCSESGKFYAKPPIVFVVPDRTKQL